MTQSENRIVILGAAGCVAGLVVERLCSMGQRPLLAGPHPEACERLAERWGGLEYVPVKWDDYQALRRLLRPGDALVSLAAPYAERGHAAVRAAADRGASYADACLEPAFLRRVHEDYGPDAEEAGVAMAPGLGAHWAAGHCAAAAALAEAGPAAAALEVDYHCFGGPEGMTRGVRAALASAMGGPALFWRAGGFVEGAPLAAGEGELLDYSGSETFLLPRRHPGLEDIHTRVAWLGGWSGLARRGGAALNRVRALPLVGAGLGRLAPGAIKAAGPPPNEEARAALTFSVRARALDAGGAALAEAEWAGGDPYRVAAGLLALGAVEMSRPNFMGRGALGPLDLFGPRKLSSALAGLGVRRVAPAEAARAGADAVGARANREPSGAHAIIKAAPGRAGAAAGGSPKPRPARRGGTAGVPPVNK